MLTEATSLVAPLFELRLYISQPNDRSPEPLQARARLLATCASDSDAVKSFRNLNKTFLSQMREICAIKFSIASISIPFHKSMLSFHRNLAGL
jgi:hypothetical protein